MRRFKLDNCDICEKTVETINYCRIGGFTYGICTDCLIKITDSIKKHTSNPSKLSERLHTRITD